MSRFPFAPAEWRRVVRRPGCRKYIVPLCDAMRPLGCPGVVCWNFEGTDGYFACALRDGDTPVCRRDPDARPEQLRIGPDTLLDYFDIGYDEWPYWCFPSDAEFRHWHADWWGRDYWRAGRYYRRVKGRKKDAKAAARRDFL